MHDRTTSPPRGGNRFATLAADPLAVAVVALGITQIIAWGCTVYALGVLSKPIAADTGWSLGAIFAGLTVALLASGLTSLPIGRWFDREGARRIMCIGSVLLAASLAALSQSHSLPVYYAAWAVIGIAMRMVLYDAAFAALVQLAPARGRRAISFLTLFGGLASSIMWPIGAALEARYGWRATLLVYAALNLCICLPLHWTCLRTSPERTADIATPSAASEPASAPAAATIPHADAATAPLAGAERRVAMLLFSITMSTSGLVTGAIAVQMVSILAATGVDPAVAVGLASVQGISQTLARLIDLVFGRSMHALTLGRMTSALLVFAVLVLAIGRTGWPVAVLFVVLFGAANGLTTIVRGAVPLALFGARGYAEVLGWLSMPVLAMNAAAPALFAVIADRAGNTAAIITLAAIALFACLSMEITSTWWQRRQRRVAQGP